MNNLIKRIKHNLGRCHKSRLGYNCHFGNGGKECE